jgi:hypothetical protein
MSNLGQTISQYWERIQGGLFPFLEERLGLLTEKQKQLIAILEVVHIEEFVHYSNVCMGRPLADRSAIVRAFIAKSFYNLPTTRDLLDRLQADKSLRRICGWQIGHKIPSESTFSRAFAEFSETNLPSRAHKTLILSAYQNEIVGQISDDSTAIEAREKPQRNHNQAALPEKKQTENGRQKKGGQQPEKEKTRIQKQPDMSLAEMLKDLPQGCDRGSKKNSNDFAKSWNGSKLHLSSEDNGVPIAAILTSASVHDSQVAIPLETLTAERVQSLYVLRDSAYDVQEIKEYSKKLNHVPIIDINPRGDVALKALLAAENKARKALNWEPAEAIRYNGRTVAERSNARLKDEFGGRTLRVKGHAKVFCHLMFGVFILAADQLMRLAS